MKRKLEAKIDTLEKSMKNLSVKLNREVLKLKEESPPFAWKISGFNGLLKVAEHSFGSL